MLRIIERRIRVISPKIKFRYLLSIKAKRNYWEIKFQMNHKFVRDIIWNQRFLMSDVEKCWTRMSQKSREKITCSLLIFEISINVNQESNDFVWVYYTNQFSQCCSRMSYSFVHFAFVFNSQKWR
jgi:hypothetical protein